MAAVQLDLALGLEAFQAKVAAAEGMLLRLKSKTDAGLSLKTFLDTSSLATQLAAAQKVLSQGNTTIKVGTDFYKTGSQHAISAAKLKTQIIDPIQQKVASDRKYTIKIGTELTFDQSSIHQIDQIVAKAKASLEAVQRSTAATRQQLAQLTQTPAQGGLDAAALRKLQSAAGQAGIKTSATGATELRKELRTAFAGAGDDAIEGLAKGLVAKSSAVIDASTKTGQALIKALKKSLGIASPSKETAKLGQASADGFGQGFVRGMVGWERQMAAAIRDAVGNAWRDGLKRDSAARGALAGMGRDAGAVISSSLGKALKDGLAGSVAPAIRGALLGGAGGAATGGLIGGLGAAGGAIKQAVMPAVTQFSYGSVPQKLGMLGHGASSLASGGASEAFNSLLQQSVDAVVQAAMSSGGQGALLGAAGVAGVAGVAGLAKGAGGSLVSQAVQSIKNRILGTAVQEAQAQAQLPGSTGGAVSAPVENASNVMGGLKSAVGTVAKGLLDFAKELTPGKLQQRIIDIAWNIDQAAEQFGVVKKDAQVLAGKIRNTWSAFSNTTPSQLLPPQPVPGTGLVRQQNLQLGGVVGRTGFDFRSPGYGTEGGRIGPADLDGGRGYIDQTRRTLQAIAGRPGEWKIVEEANGVWQRIKSDSELAAERLAIVNRNITQAANQSQRNSYRTWTDREGVGTFNPFDQAFYRPTQPPQAPPPGGGGSFGGNRFGTPTPGGALALRNVPVEVFTSFKEAERLLALVEQRLSAVGKAFDTLKVKSQIQVDQEIRKLAVSLRAAELAFQKGEISASDLRAASYGAAREMAGLGAKSAEVQNLAQAFENLGIQSRSAVEALQDQRNLDLGFIESTMGRGSSEATRARNARDIQQLSRANDLVRTAQGASGFGGFRGREIGNDALNQAQQRSTLANAIREMQEYQGTLKLTETNARTYQRVQAALNTEIRNAERAFAVLNGTASDGERIAHVARNAWGTILDDFQNLVPQLLVFAVAYNLILQRVLTTPGAVIQAAASFDRLETSISSYLSATRGIGDASGVIGELKQVALDLGIGFDKAASSYLRFAAATQGTPLQGQEVDIARTLATAGRNQGLGGEQIDRASVALTQILSKGQVQSEELRQQLAEQLPGALQVAARAFGVTTKELYRMVEAGQIAGDEFVKKFIQQLKDEGADVNQLAGSFSNVSEQLGSSLQLFAAAAGEPFLQPLTQALRLLNSVITTVIPLATPLAALFIAIGSNALKSALQIKQGWGGAVMQAITGSIGGGSPILGTDGQPLSSGKGQQVKNGLQQAKQGVIGLGVALAGNSSEGTLKAMSNSAKELGAGLKNAAGASLGLGAGLKAALAPTLKLYLAIEAISFAIKLATGQIGKLNDEQRKSDRVLAGKGSDGEQYNPLQKALAAFNVGRFFEDSLTEGRTQQIAANAQETKRKIDANIKVIKKASSDWVAIDRQLYEARNKLRDTDSAEQEKALKEEIERLEKRRKGIVDTLPKGIKPSDVQAQITSQKAAIQAAEERLKKREALTDFLPWEASTVTNEKELIKELEKSNEELEKRLKLYNQLGQIPTVAGMGASLKRTQDYLSGQDVNSAEYARAQKIAAGKEKVLSDATLLAEERRLAEQEVALRAITAQMQVQEQIGKIRLARLDSEKKLLEANLSLERTRTRLQETLAQRSVDVANAVDAPEEALAAEVNLRRVREAGQAKDLQMQAQVISKDRERVKIQTSIQKDQIKLQNEQLKLERLRLDIELVRLDAAAKVARKDKFGDLVVMYENMAKHIRVSVKSTDELIAQRGQLLASVEQQGAAELAVLDIKRQELDIEKQINKQGSLTQDQLNQIDAAKQQIANKEQQALDAAAKAQRVLDQQEQSITRQLDAVQAITEAQRERLQISQEAAQAEMGLLDRLLELQTGRNDGGFFERLSKASLLGASGEQEAYAIAQRRMQLMQEIQQKQIRQQQLELDLKKKQLLAEQAINQLKLRGQRIELETAQIALRKQMEEQRLRLSMLGGSRTPDQEASFKDLTEALSMGGGFNADTQLNSTGLKTVNYTALMRDYMTQTQALTDQIARGESVTAEQLAAYEDYFAAKQKEINVLQELGQLDTAQWFAQFRDQSTQLGRTLGVLTTGLSEFRSTVSQAFSDAITNGASVSDAIADAGQALAGKVVTGLLDEMILKPMETNIFKGLEALGIGKPMSEQASLKASTDAAATSTDALTRANDGLTKAVEDNTRALRQSDALLPKPTMETPTYRAPDNAGLTAAVGGIANMLPGTRGGPNINEGVGYGRGRLHAGQDLGLDVGDPIHARRSGTVKRAYNSGFGQVGGAVVLGYDDGTEGTYGHVSPGVRVGQAVSAGQRIATVAPDGQNTHLHYELRDGFGKLLNPLNAIKQSLQVPAGALGGTAAVATAGALPPATMSPLTGTSSNPVPVTVVAGASGSPALAGAIPPAVLNPLDWGQATSINFGDLGIQLGDLSTVFSETSTALQAIPLEVNGLQGSIQGSATAIGQAGNAAQSMPTAFRQLNTSIGAATQALAGIGMIAGGVGMMQGGGTYNTLMGLAGIFGGISSIAGMFTPAGALGGLFGGGRSAAAPAATGPVSRPEAFSMGPLLGRASGGPVAARQPYLVGEQGPELFIPEGHGRVLPNGHTQALLDSRSALTGGASRPGTTEALAASRETVEATTGLSRQREQQQLVTSLNASAKPMDVRYETQVINSVEYVTADQFQRGISDAAERGRALTLSALRNSIKARKQVGI